MVENSGVPWTILRATQFHYLTFVVLRLLERLPVMPVPKGFVLQPIDAEEVANRLTELALSEPASRVPDVGGPEARTTADLAHAYLDASGRQRRLAEMPIPGRVGRAFWEGARLIPRTSTALSPGMSSSTINLVFTPVKETLDSHGPLRGSPGPRRGSAASRTRRRVVHAQYFVAGDSRLSLCTFPWRMCIRECRRRFLELIRKGEPAILLICPRWIGLKQKPLSNLRS